MSFDRPRSNDQPQMNPQQCAEALRQKHRGRWLVLWSIYDKCFIAYPTWVGGGGYTIKAPSEQELEQMMSETEQASLPVQFDQRRRAFPGAPS